MHADGLPLPPALIDVAQQGRWTAPAGGNYIRIFGEPAYGPVFLKVDQMRRNARWIDEIDYDDEFRQLYIGEPDPANPPGDIDPQMSLLLGDLGSDQPFALDFRRSMEAPSVVYLDSTMRWVEVAPTIDAFIVELGL
ncbi:hypothetical protein I0C86_05900 [Plantactinospora sp. S1510]|uniref:SMI1/KNR4 family protein n=1 Tax=Plantactinospora alkalitolerans TaxID=2789879 RepID=A0ABS0GQP2_9ACTN|nr:hypothetical protein [Plantactinospora alkalitolerans]MBF9128523.1 hypothetical protein [Plantactinospora alkalitolerans]